MGLLLSKDDILTLFKNVKSYIDTKYTELKNGIDTRVPQTQLCQHNGGQGLIKIKDLSGIKVSSDGTISIDPATKDDITRQTDNCKPITPKYLSDVFNLHGTIKKKIFEEVTTDTTGGIYFSSNITKSIVLGAYTTSDHGSHSICLEPWYNRTGDIYLHATQSDNHADIVSESIANVIVYYIDIQNAEIAEELVKKEVNSDE